MTVRTIEGQLRLPDPLPVQWRAPPAYACWCLFCESFWAKAGSVEEGRRLVVEHEIAAHPGGAAA